MSFDFDLFVIGGGSGGVVRVNAIQRLSGLKTGAPVTPGTWNASPPPGPIGRNHVLLRSPGSPSGSRRLELNASSVPSGLQRGFDECVPPCPVIGHA